MEGPSAGGPLVERQHQAVRRRSRQSPTIASSLPAKSGSFERWKVRRRGGCTSCAAQIAAPSEVRSRPPSVIRSSLSPSFRHCLVPCRRNSSQRPLVRRGALRAK